MEISFVLGIVGRILFGGFFIMNGINHLKNYKGLSVYASSYKVPMPTLSVIITGLMILLGGLGVMLGVYTMLSLWLIILFLLPVSFMMHAFWKETDANVKMSQNVQFMKNMALLGASLMLLAF